MDRVEVLKLADLARIRLSEVEAERLSGEFEVILDYVGEIKEMASENGRPQTPSDYPVRNVMREDGVGHETGIHTDKLLREAPLSTGNYIKVKKIL